MVNKVILVGNVGMDPEVRTLETGAKVARVRLATMWRGLADVVDRFVRKGSQIYIEGRLRTREWTDKDGNKRYTTEILADAMNLLGRRQDSAPADSQPAAGYGAPQQPAYAQPAQPAYTPQPAAPQAPAQPADELDDLPF